MRTKLLRFLLVGSLLIGSIATASADNEVENVEAYRIGVEMDWKLFDVKGLKFSLAPQLRYGEGFDYEQMVIETGVRYKTFGFLYWSANYRLTVEPTGEMMQTDKYGRYFLSLTAKESFGDFTPSLRAMYTNYTNEDVNDTEYMRYRAKVNYDIPKCPITPYLSTELFYDMDENLLNRTRIGAGVDYKVKKNNYIGLDYKLDYYALKYKNRHIFSLGYKVSF